ncbi:alpha/beta hydrolase [Phaeovibrio sulfidiphilus]|uniref:Alpha/beta hydrolase n=1 Tax=Phaeovibrio sulfidiphilus TaxID=1220600 RepID=A0A8J6YN45_9PROT|nr:alpha/beta hydrolase [Phaeovibrio sulfidiphilus]MBE1237828.1 alpha/beta hydrolase [Phaeovibrio sulfidiphilus]
MARSRSRLWSRKGLASVLIASAVLCGGAFAVRATLAPSLPFHPTRDIVSTPMRMGMPFEEVRLHTADGERLGAWFVPARSGADTPVGRRTLLFCHGNAGNISHRIQSIALFNGLGLDVLIFDYRGFGESSGTPSVRGTEMDARAAWDWLVREKGVSPGDIVIYGRSLGGGVAASLAARVQPGGLILDSTFTTIQDVLETLYPGVPGRFFLPQDFDTPKALESVSVPLLVFHSTEDETVPYALGQRLFEGYGGANKTLRPLRGDHNTGFLQDIAAYRSAVQTYLESLP